MTDKSNWPVPPVMKEKALQRRAFSLYRGAADSTVAVHLFLDLRMNSRHVP
jgi:hypothetical protein